MDAKKYIREWAGRYRADFVDNIMPFWMEHGLDRVNGGVYTCLDRDGSLMDSTKSVWFQGRFGYIAAAAYNRIEKRREWLDASRSCIDFIEAHCIDPSDGHMYFEVMADGTPLRKRRYVFSESFAALAMAEYSIATEDKAWANRALEIYRHIRYMLDTPGFLTPKYEPVMQGRGHSITMILINTGSRIREALGHDAPAELTDSITEAISQIERYFMHPEFKALLETVGPDGEFIDTLAGRVINPGHCIETSWFIMEEARRRSDKKMLDLALTILDWSWEWGWDKMYGGIINFRDCRDLPAQDYSQDMKFWWPQTETIIASLYAYLLTGNNDYLYMHKQISDWTYAHFPDKEYPEWYGYLHRDGTVAQSAKGNIFKGPFHIPRMMIHSFCLCNDILEMLDTSEQ